METQKNTLFPVFFKLDLLNTLIVGGGKVGLEKLTALLSNNPNAGITLVGKTISREIHEYTAAYPGVTLKEKAFSKSDLEQMDLVIIATNDPGKNKEIYTEAKREKLLVNVADTPDLCDFYLGSIVQKGSLKIAISTNGQSPTFAKRLRETLTEVLPDEIETTLQNLRSIRNSLKGDFTHKVKKLNEITSILVPNHKTIH